MVKQINRLFDFVKLHFGYNPWDQTSTDFFCFTNKWNIYFYIRSQFINNTWCQSTSRLTVKTGLMTVLWLPNTCTKLQIQLICQSTALSFKCGLRSSVHHGDIHLSLRFVLLVLDNTCTSPTVSRPIVWAGHQRSWAGDKTYFWALS